uniref:uncharacterized protein LOC120343260 isoform X2 n=1 Tax=Styela clava TaxID=7725 RepID=UPI00193A3C02|nr:uncharacterized protein LOC120343260 isoform X2 [Styela clava]
MTGTIRIREMRPEDSDFAAKLLVTCFRKTFEWAVGEKNLNGVINIEKRSMQNAPSCYYKHSLIATISDQLVGVCVLKMKSDSNPNEGSFCYTYSNVGCRGCCGLWCMGVCSSYFMHENLFEKSSSCYLDVIFVHPEFQQRGIGSRLLCEAEVKAAESGCNKIYLWVEADNYQAIHLYKRQGYSVIRDVDGVCFTYCGLGSRYYCKMEKYL